MIDPSLTAKATKELIEFWLKNYKKNRQLTLTFSFIIFIASTATVIGIAIAENERKIERLKNSNYEDQIRLLNDTQFNLKNLTEFIEIEKRKLQESEKALNSLKEEEKLLKPIIEGDRQTIESILQLQNQRNQANLSTERWIGFGFGVLSSLIASIVWAGIAYFVNRRKGKSEKNEPVSEQNP